MVQSAFLNEHKVILAGASAFVADFADYSSGNPATDVINMSNWRRIIFIIAKGAGAVGTATITIESCDDVTPTTATAIQFYYRKSVGATDTFTAWAINAASGATTGVTTTAGADQVYEFTVTDDMLSGSDKYVRLKVTQVDVTATKGAIVAILCEPRHADYLNAPTVLT